MPQKLDEEKMSKALKVSSNYLIDTSLFQAYVYSSPPITLAEAAFLNQFWTWSLLTY